MSFKKINPVTTNLQHLEVIKLISNFMLSNNYQNSMSSLMQKCGISISSPFSKSFENSIITGDWKSVLVELESYSAFEILSYNNENINESGFCDLNKHDNDDEPCLHTFMHYLVCEETYLDFLEDGQISEAVYILRNQLSKYRELFPQRINHLSCAIMEKDIGQWRQKLSGYHNRLQNRLLLLNRLRHLVHLHQKDALDPYRLSRVLDYGMIEELSHCVSHAHQAAHLFQPQHNISYMQPHLCNKTQLPSRPVLRLPMQFQTLAVKFSPNGHYLSTIEMKSSGVKQLGDFSISENQKLMSLSFVIYKITSSLLQKEMMAFYRNGDISCHSLNLTKLSSFQNVGQIDFEADIYASHYHSLQWNSTGDRIALLCMTEVIIFNVSYHSNVEESLTVSLMGRCHVAKIMQSPLMSFLPNTNFLLITNNDGKMKILDCHDKVSLVAQTDGTRIDSFALIEKPKSSEKNSVESSKSFILYWIDNRKRFCSSEISLSETKAEARQGNIQENSEVMHSSAATLSPAASPADSYTADLDSAASPVLLQFSESVPQRLRVLQRENEDAENTSDESVPENIVRSEIFRDSRGNLPGSIRMPYSSRSGSGGLGSGQQSSSSAYYNVYLRGPRPRDTSRNVPMSSSSSRIHYNEQDSLNIPNATNQSNSPILLEDTTRTIRQGFGLRALRLLTTLLTNSPSDRSSSDAAYNAISRFASALDDNEFDDESMSPHVRTVQIGQENVLTPCTYTHQVRRLDKYQIVTCEDDNHKIHDIAIASDTGYLFTAHSTSIRRWNAHNGTMLREYNLEGCLPKSQVLPNSLAFSPRSDYLSVLTTNSPLTVDLMNVETMHLIIWEIHNSRPLHILPYHVDSKVIGYLKHKNQAHFDLPQQFQVLWHPSDPTVLLTLHPDGNVFLWGNENEPVRNSTFCEEKSLFTAESLTKLPFHAISSPSFSSSSSSFSTIISCNKRSLSTHEPVQEEEDHHHFQHKRACL